jgi:hypothetical protein
MLDEFMVLHMETFVVGFRGQHRSSLGETGVGGA